MFGGHTGSEMASLQKAAYLGLKAGNPKVIACQNVFAIHRAATLHDFDANEAWAYFDTFNLHCYEQLQGYPKAFADFRAVSAGKPMWVTEISVRVKWQGDEQLKELSDEDLRLQSERVTKTYALALHQGAAEVFYFMLPQYSEGTVQFGLLHADLTPRPGYLALAAVGRLLADAKPLGPAGADRTMLARPISLSARPDGKTGGRSGRLGSERGDLRTADGAARLLRSFGPPPSGGGQAAQSGAGAALRRACPKARIPRWSRHPNQPSC